MKAIYKQVTKASYIRAVSAMAGEIWAECYQRALPGRQLKLALAQYQSAEAIEEAIDSGVNYFLVQLAGKDIGYFAFHVTAAAVIIDHIYLYKNMRTRGLGRDILTYCEKLAAGEGQGQISLSVPQKCQDTVTFFKHRGYRIGEETALFITGGEPLPLYQMGKSARF